MYTFFYIFYLHKFYGGGNLTDAYFFNLLSQTVETIPAEPAKIDQPPVHISDKTQNFLKCMPWQEKLVGKTVRRIKFRIPSHCTKNEILN